MRLLRRGDVNLAANIVAEVIAAADVCEDLPSLWIDCHKRAVMPVGFLFAFGQLLFDDALAESLQVEVERRRDLQPAAAGDAIAGDVFRGLE